MALLPLGLSFPYLKRPVFTGHHKLDESPGPRRSISSRAMIYHCFSCIATQPFAEGDKQAPCRGSQVGKVQPHQFPTTTSSSSFVWCMVVAVFSRTSPNKSESCRWPHRSTLVHSPSVTFSHLLHYKHGQITFNGACNYASTRPKQGGNCAPTEFPEGLTRVIDSLDQAVDTLFQGIDVSPLLTHACMQRRARPRAHCGPF